MEVRVGGERQRSRGRGGGKVEFGKQTGGGVENNTGDFGEIGREAQRRNDNTIDIGESYTRYYLRTRRIPSPTTAKNSHSTFQPLLRFASLIADDGFMFLVSHSDYKSSVLLNNQITKIGDLKDPEQLMEFTDNNIDKFDQINWATLMVRIGRLEHRDKNGERAGLSEERLERGLYTAINLSTLVLTPLPTLASPRAPSALLSNPSYKSLIKRLCTIITNNPTYFGPRQLGNIVHSFGRLPPSTLSLSNGLPMSMLSMLVGGNKEDCEWVTRVKENSHVAQTASNVAWATAKVRTDIR